MRSAGADNSPLAKFCEDCGAGLGTPAAVAKKKSDEPQIRVAEAPASENLDGERKTVTALFADIKGSTELMRDLDPEEARAMTNPALRLMVEAVRRYDGYVVDPTGDGIFALFGAPVAHRGPSAARPIRRADAAAVDAHSWRETGAKAISPFCRHGLGSIPEKWCCEQVQTGGRMEYTPIGHVTNLASRLEALSPAGGIVVSSDTRALIEGYFETRALAPVEIKGIPEPVEVSEVTGLGLYRTRDFQISARRGLTRFVGREREMTEIKRAHTELARGGEGHRGRS